eukprot:2922867-Pyramimonas_sp.AAC.1
MDDADADPFADVDVPIPIDDGWPEPPEFEQEDHEVGQDRMQESWAGGDLSRGLPYPGARQSQS